MYDDRYPELRKAYGRFLDNIDAAVNAVGIWVKPITDKWYELLEDHIKKLKNYPYSLIHHSYSVKLTHPVLNDVIHWNEPFINEVIINAVQFKLDPLEYRIGYLDDPVNVSKQTFHIDFTHDVKIYNDDTLQWGMVDGVPYLMDQFGKRTHIIKKEWWNDHE